MFAQFCPGVLTLECSQAILQDFLRSVERPLRCRASGVIHEMLENEKRWASEGYVVFYHLYAAKWKIWTRSRGVEICFDRSETRTCHLCLLLFIVLSD